MMIWFVVLNNSIEFGEIRWRAVKLRSQWQRRRRRRSTSCFCHARSSKLWGPQFYSFEQVKFFPLRGCRPVCGRRKWATLRAHSRPLIWPDFPLSRPVGPPPGKPSQWTERRRRRRLRENSSDDGKRCSRSTSGNENTQPLSTICTDSKCDDDDNNNE